MKLSKLSAFFNSRLLVQTAQEEGGNLNNKRTSHMSRERMDVYVYGMPAVKGSLPNWSSKRAPCSHKTLKIL